MRAELEKTKKYLQPIYCGGKRFIYKPYYIKIDTNSNLIYRLFDGVDSELKWANIDVIIPKNGGRPYYIYNSDAVDKATPKAVVRHIAEFLQQFLPNFEVVFANRRPTLSTMLTNGTPTNNLLYWNYGYPCYDRWGDLIRANDNPTKLDSILVDLRETKH